MKIGILHERNSGFFPRFYRDLSEAISLSGNDWVLLTPNSGANKRNPLPKQRLYGARWNWFVHFHLYKLIGLQDIFSSFSTLCLIWALRKEKVDVVHMHIVNSWMCNLPLLFWYLRRKNIPVVWTMHDCRAFTGRCAHFEQIRCFRWREKCGHCPEKRFYWPTIIDNSALQLYIRRRTYNLLKHLYIVSPSKWMANYVRQSILKGFPISVIYNGIDISKFSAVEKSDFRARYKLESKKVVLGVAVYMGKLKGLFYLNRLADELPEDYKVVIVGQICEDERVSLSPRVLSLPPIKDVSKLAEVMRSADVFVNPTLVDNFPTTNIECLAAGTPVVTFQTGGSAESIDETCGIAVPKGDYKALEKAVVTVCNDKQRFSEANCHNRAGLFSKDQFKKYVDLYKVAINKSFSCPTPK